MNTWTKSILTGIIAAALGFFLFSSVLNPKKSKDNGLKDLFSASANKSSEAHYLIKVVPDNDKNSGVMDIVAEVIMKRMEAGDYPCKIKKEGDQILDIVINNIDDTNFVAKLLTANCKVEFREVYTLNDIAAALSATDKITEKYLPVKKTITKPVKTDSLKNSSGNDSNVLKTLEIPEDEVVYGLASLISFALSYENNNSELYPQIGTVKVKDTALVNRILGDNELMAIMPHDAKFFFGPADYVSEKDNKKTLLLYCLKILNNKTLVLENEDVKSAQVAFSSNGRPEVELQFTALGTRKWARMTTDNAGKNIAIVVDKIVVSAPHVNEPITTGNSIISGGFTASEVESLAMQLSGGRVPAEISIIKSEIKSEKSTIDIKIFLFTLIAFIIATGASWPFFNTLKKT